MWWHWWPEVLLYNLCVIIIIVIIIIFIFIFIFIIIIIIIILYHFHFHQHDHEWFPHTSKLQLSIFCCPCQEMEISGIAPEPCVETWWTEMVGWWSVWLWKGDFVGFWGRPGNVGLLQGMIGMELGARVSRVSDGFWCVFGSVLRADFKDVSWQSYLDSVMALKNGPETPGVLWVCGALNWENE